MGKISSNAWKIFANNPHKDCSLCPIGFRIFDIPEIDFYTQRASGIEDYINEKLKCSYGESNMIAEVSFDRQFCCCNGDESLRYLYQNRFEIEITKYAFDIELSENIPILGSSFDIPLSVANEEAMRLVEEKINELKKVSLVL